MLGLEEFARGFMNGMRLSSLPDLDISSMESIGCHDGYVYKQYLDRIGQEEFKQEQLIAVIDKYHTQALKRYQGNDIKELSGNRR